MKKNSIRSEIAKRFRKDSKRVEDFNLNEIIENSPFFKEKQRMYKDFLRKHPVPKDIFN